LSTNDASGWVHQLDACAGPTAFFEEETQDEKVAEVAAKWLGERLLAIVVCSFWKWLRGTF